MKSRLNLKPGQRGTKRLVERYGEALLYVRYRYDAERGVRLKTVEIIVEEKPWRPRSRFREEDLVEVVVGYSEQDLRAKLKTAGGRWNGEDKVWLVRYGSIRGTELECRIVGNA
jgi:hypothetical protein